jgi:hypothetical protein
MYGGLTSQQLAYINSANTVKTNYLRQGTWSEGMI